MNPARQTKLLAALDHFKSRRLREAQTLLEELVEQNPNDSDALFLLGSLQMEVDLQRAEQLLMRCVVLAPGHRFVRHYLGKIRHLRGEDEVAVVLLRQAVRINPNFAPTFNDLGTSLHQIGERDEAVAAFDQAIALDPDYMTAHVNRGVLLAEMRRAEEADAAFRRVLASQPCSADAWNNCGIAHYHLGQFDQAIGACRQALALDPSHSGASATLLQSLGRANRDHEAKEAGADWSKKQGITTTPCTGSYVDARILLVRASEFCNVPTDFLFDRKRFETVTVYLPPSMRSDDELLARIADFENFDVAFNAIGDADRGEPFFAAASELLDALGCPVLNPPDQIRPTRRDLLPSLLADIPGLVVPKTQRMTRAELFAYARAEARNDAPFLLRPIGSHGGDDLVRIENRSQLGACLTRSRADEYYVSDYCDYRSADGYFRKYRLIFVDRQVYPYHLAISKHWLVHYWRAEMTGWMKEEEQAFLADTRSAFNGAAEEAIQEVARRLDLDYGGMDCAILPDGRVLVFEANSTMLVHLRDSRDDFAYKHEHVPRIIDAMSNLVLRRTDPRPTYALAS
jgi:tetratricopeptide (TPR) repeat protein